VRIFSGIQPTGRKHLGNFLGAIVQYVESQDRGEGIFCVVDLHALTVPFDSRCFWRRGSTRRAARCFARATYPSTRK